MISNSVQLLRLQPRDWTEGRDHEPILSIAVVALCSMLMAGCWFYSRPEGDPSAGCQKTTYGFVTATKKQYKLLPRERASRTATLAIAGVTPALSGPDRLRCRL